jgi:ABC-type transport system involved in cytochrome c biogenesis permease component
MREYTEPTPVDLQSFSTGRILKESWEISTKYFGALVMPMVVLMIPGMIIAAAIDGKPGEAILTFIVSVVMLAVLIDIVSATDLDPEGPLVTILVLPLLVPYATWLTYTYVAFSLTYLTLKPAPTEENQLPAN